MATASAPALPRRFPCIQRSGKLRRRSRLHHLRMTATAGSLPDRTPPLRAIPALGNRVDTDARRGAAAMLAVFVGFLPFGCLVGVAVARSAQPAAAWAGVWLIFAGSAHLTAIQLVDSGAGAFTAVLTAAM